MFRILSTAGALAVAATAFVAVPTLADAQPHHYKHHYHSTRDQRCKGARQRSANTGTVVGAVGGGLAGNLIGGHSLTGTLVGAGVGAVAGHQIGKHNSSCR